VYLRPKTLYIFLLFLFLFLYVELAFLGEVASSCPCL